MEKLKLVPLLGKMNGKRNLSKEQKQWLSAQKWPITNIFKVFGNFPNQTPWVLTVPKDEFCDLPKTTHPVYNGVRTQFLGSDFKSDYLPKMFFNEETSVSLATSSGPFENHQQKFPRSDYVFSRSKHLQSETKNNKKWVTNDFRFLFSGSESSFFLLFPCQKKKR